MTVDHFTTSQFLDACQDIGRQIGGIDVTGPFLEMGEQVFTITLDAQVEIVIRSSIGPSGVSDDAGENSIRFWMRDRSTGKQISKYPDAYTTRVPGWMGRLADKLSLLATLRSLAGDCTGCSRPLSIYATTAGPNKGRIFCKCFECGTGFTWLRSADHDIERSIRPAVFINPKKLSIDPVETPFPKPALPQFEFTFEKEPPTMPTVIEESPPNSSIDALDAVANLFDAIDELEEQEPAVQPVSDREPNPEQLAAITAPVQGALRVIAPPGSGKTFLLIRRIKFLVDNGVNLSNILVVAFNKSMAEEIASRLVALCSELAENPIVHSNVSTIHAACYRMLRSYGVKLNVPDGRDGWKIRKFFQDLIPTLWKEADHRPTWTEVKDWIYTARFHGLEQPDLYGYFCSTLGVEHAHHMVKVEAEYAKFMERAGWITFNDMLYQVELLLKTDKVFRTRMQAMYQYVLIDEGQDVSAQARRILFTVAAPHNNLFIVGDPDQLLYRFTGATPEENLYQGFEKAYPTGQTVTLVTNYRSTPTIIETCNRLIAHNYTDLGGPYPSKYFKNVQARPGAEVGKPVSIEIASNPGEETSLVIANIQRLLVDGYNPQDIFVTSRTRAQLAYLEAFLRKAKIPFVNLTGASFWSLRHIQDVLAMLTVAYNPRDAEAFSKVYNISSVNFVAPWGEDKGSYVSHHFLPRACLAEIPTLKDAQTACKTYRFPFKYSYKAGMDDLVDFYYEVQAQLNYGGVSGALAYITDYSYLKHVRFDQGLEDEADGGIMEDVRMLIQISADFKDCKEFLDFCAENKAQAEKTENIQQAMKTSVVISTVHRVKGMERPVMIGIGVGEGYRQVGENQLPAGLLPHTFSLTLPPQDGIFPGRGMSPVEDERCIFFVMVSRAAKEVYLYFPEKVGDVFLSGSRFLSEAGIQ